MAHVLDISNTEKQKQNKTQNKKGELAMTFMVPASQHYPESFSIIAHNCAKLPVAIAMMVSYYNIILYLGLANVNNCLASVFCYVEVISTFNFQLIKVFEKHHYLFLMQMNCVLE